MKASVSLFLLLFAACSARQTKPQPIEPPELPVAHYAEAPRGVCSLDSSRSDKSLTTSLNVADARSDAASLDGQRVRVCGFIHIAFEDTALYPTKESYTQHSYSKGDDLLWIDWLPAHDTARACEGHWMCAEGTMNGRDHHVIKTLEYLGDVTWVFPSPL